MRQLLLPCFLLLLPAAHASGTIETPFGGVVFENGHTDGCVEDATGLCLASAEGGSLGAMTLDLHQRATYLAIFVDDSRVEDELGHELLPDGSIVVDLSKAKHPHPVFRLLVENVGTRRAPAPLSDFALVFEQDRYGIESLGPRLTEEGVVLAPSDDLNGGYGTIVRYDQVGPLNYSTRQWTDREIASAQLWTCRYARALQAPTCERELAIAAQALQTHTPNVVFGLAVESVETATGGLPERDAAPIGDRGDAGVGERVATPAHEWRPLETRREAPAGAWAETPPAPAQQPPLGAPAGYDHPPSGQAREPEASTGASPSAPLLALSAAFALAILLAALYSRLSRSRIATTNEHRQRTLAILQERRAASLAELARELGIDRTTLLYHARMLKHAGLVALRSQGRAIYICLPGVAPPPPTSKHARLADTFLTAIAEAGGALSRAELHRRFAEHSARARNHAIRHLVASGIAARAFEGNEEIVRSTAPRPSGQ